MPIRLLYFVHRWGGVALALFMTLWLVSGLVIVYVGPLAQSRTQQLAHEPSLVPDTAWLSLGEAWARAQRDANETIASARLVRVAGEPLWVVENNAGGYVGLSAVTGEPQAISPDQATRIASDWLDRDRTNTASQIRYVDTVDFTTSLANYKEFRPFHRVAIDDGAGTELLISARTGDVLQAATRVDRGLYLVGNWLHFFRPIESLGAPETRRDVLMWAGFIATVAAITGMVIGWLRWRPGYFGKPTYSKGRTQPYRTFWLRWHFWAGLIGGTFAVLWTLSGYLNTNPWQIFSAATASRAELARFQGKTLPPEITQWHPQDLGGDFVELGWSRIGDQAVLLGYGHDGSRTPQPVNGTTPRFADQTIALASQRLVGGAGVTEQTLIGAYDNYYYLVHNRDAAERPLPVVQVKLADQGKTYLYIDPLDGRVISKYDANRRVYRWLFSAVHRWDIGWLYWRPVWDVWIDVWIAFGLVLSVSSVVLGWRRVRRTLAARLAPAEETPSPSLAGASSSSGS